MKRLLLVLVLMVSVSSAFAADLKVTGDMMVQGNMDRMSTKVAGAKSDQKADFFESDLNINLALIANENATVFVKLTYDNSDQYDNGGLTPFKQGRMKGEVANGSGTNGAGADVGLTVERAYMNYKFAPFLQLNVGLMGGGKWASNFSDTEINVPRVQFFVPLAKDMMFWATYEKNAENSYDINQDKTRNDITSYYLSGIIGVGPITLFPLLKYVTDDATPGSHKTTSVIDFGVNGDFGMVGFVAEGIYGIKNNDKAVSATVDKKQTLYGGYVDVFVKVDPAKVGVAAFMTSASSDAKKASFATGDDFNFSIVVGDMNEYATAGLLAVNGGKVYAEAKVDKLTAKAAFAYFMSSDKKVAAGLFAYDFKAWEVDATANYAFDAAASYEVGIGYAGMKFNADAAGTVKIDAKEYRVYNKFAVKF